MNTSSINYQYYHTCQQVTELRHKHGVIYVTRCHPHCISISGWSYMSVPQNTVNRPLVIKKLLRLEHRATELSIMKMNEHDLDR